MSRDPTSLERLHDILLPPEAPWWPLPAGWQCLGAFAILLIALVLLQQLFEWQANCYRREALRALNDQKIPPSEWSGILKRTALSVWPRDDVAPLTGLAWLAFLDRTANMTGFSSGAGQDLELLAFTKVTDPDVGALKGLVRYWILHHRKEG